MLFRVVLVICSLRGSELLKPENVARCYENEAYCLFTFGPKMNVYTVEGATTVCERAKPGTWPAYTMDKRQFDVLQEYINGVTYLANDSVIVHAKKKDGKWIWISDDTKEVGFQINNEILKKYLKTDNMLYISNTQSARPPVTFRVVCLQTCASKVTRNLGHGFKGGTAKPGMTQIMCSVICESDRSCKAWGWATKGCFMYNDISVENTADEADVKVLDKSTKNPETCLGSIADVTPPPPPVDVGSTLMIFWPLVTIGSFTIVLSIFCGFQYRKFKREEERRKAKAASLAAANMALGPIQSTANPATE